MHAVQCAHCPHYYVVINCACTKPRGEDGARYIHVFHIAYMASHGVILVSLPHSASKLPSEIILQHIYPHSCRLEAAVKWLQPSCELCQDADSPSFAQLCSAALVASERTGLLTRDASASQILASMSISSYNIPGRSPLESVLNAVPVEVRNTKISVCSYIICCLLIIVIYL